MTNGTFTTVKMARITALMVAPCLFLFLFCATVAHADATDTITITISIDDAGMVSSDVTSPTEGFTFSTDTVTIEGTSTSSNGVVSLVQVSIDDDTWHNASNTGANYSTWEYATGTLLIGPHTVTSRASNEYDSTGAPSTTINFTVSSPADTTPPDFSGITSVSDTMQGGKVGLEWSEATNDASTPYIYNIFYAQTSGGQNFAAPQATTAATSTFIAGLTDEQIYHFIVRAEDSVGNESTTTVELSAAPTCKSELSVSVATSSVVSPLGGDPVPGTLVGYIINYSNSPSYCYAEDMVLSNNIPANADFYATGGITLDGSTKTIAIDGDECALLSAPDRVKCIITTLTAGASGTLEFKVTKD